MHYRALALLDQVSVERSLIDAVLALSPFPCAILFDGQGGILGFNDAAGRLTRHGNELSAYTLRDLWAGPDDRISFAEHTAYMTQVTERRGARPISHALPVPMQCADGIRTVDIAVIALGSLPQAVIDQHGVLRLALFRESAS